ncbi:MAG: hypothetical protein A3F18_06225 [Legionellales bacterium RIFCSPHIGHO2_12_FULL_37_14]|nr:MAG: hypothetical protein A3F18_06225 [Legionellales bacterium RIFCSPHIGHO2_12_FULL_37_14]
MRAQILCILSLIICLIGCSVETSAKYEYGLKCYSTTHSYKQHKLSSLYISAPEAVAEFQTNEMLYSKVPYEITSFSKNSWSNPPAEMLYPLMLQSFQESRAFRVIASGTHAEISRFRLDTQLLELIQIFTKTSSSIHLTVKAMITDTTSARLIGSKVFKIVVPCPFNTPYGGASAANRAAGILTYQLTNYTISVVRRT